MSATTATGKIASRWRSGKVAIGTCRSFSILMTRITCLGNRKQNRKRNHDTQLGDEQENTGAACRNGAGGQRDTVYLIVERVPGAEYDLVEGFGPTINAAVADARRNRRERSDAQI